MNSLSSRRALIVILALYGLLGAGYIVRTPAWQAPDEPAHYNYVAQIAEQGCCPLIEVGDWDQAYLSALTSARFAPDLLDRRETIEYEDHQPPLYYLLASIPYRLSDGALWAVRLFSLLTGAGVILCAYGVGWLLTQRSLVAVGAAGIVAFVPQRLAIMSAVNNDALAELIIAVGLLVAIRYEKHGRGALLMSVIAGLAALIKASALLLFGVFGLVIVLRSWRERVGMRQFWRDVLLFLLPALLLAGIWWGRNLVVYGVPDFLGLRAHDRVVVGQLRTADAIADQGLGPYLRSGLKITFNSFWGQFGWMALPLHGWIYGVIAAGLGVAAVGWIARARGRAQRLSSRGGWFAVAFLTIFTVLQFVYYNTEFVQFQGRYLYPALIPFALLIVLGMEGWALWFEKRGRSFVWSGLLLLPAVLLILLNVYVLWRVIPLLNP